MTKQVFSVPVFLIVLRETIEAALVVSVLLAFLKQTLGGVNGDRAVYKSLVKQVWIGAVLGFLLCLVVGGAVIGTFYRVGKNVWEAAENIYEGVFYLIAGLIITFVGAGLLRIGKMQEKWRVKLAKALDKPLDSTNTVGKFKRFTIKYSLFILSFITVSREGIEGVVFVSGVSFSAPATSIPLPVVIGLIVGCFIGWALYKGGSLIALQMFLIASTCLLYLVAAGLIARSAGYFEAHHWNGIVGGDAAELGDGPGSYDLHRSVWHVNCCSPDLNGGGGWGIFNGILGWSNSATYSTIISYNIYWLLVILGFSAMGYSEIHGHWPFLKRKISDVNDSEQDTELSNGALAAGGLAGVSDKVVVDDRVLQRAESTK
ncbi:hypothetical protein jhhlp_001739 [Lomentospora prolificans]|uniref:Plasma membrane iron permease n=1 Tax=Lomentospora prolificans TaxID=41688 RepID=A0A2N3NH36_9PEZI|nr:hypothetical protein jhhlp_001739 [Lomentospora prolificans]